MFLIAKIRNFFTKKDIDSIFQKKPIFLEIGIMSIMEERTSIATTIFEDIPISFEIKRTSISITPQKELFKKKREINLNVKLDEVKNDLEVKKLREKLWKDETLDSSIFGKFVKTECSDPTDTSLFSSARQYIEDTDTIATAFSEIDSTIDSIFFKDPQSIHFSKVNNPSVSTTHSTGSKGNTSTSSGKGKNCNFLEDRKEKFRKTQKKLKKERKKVPKRKSKRALRLVKFDPSTFSKSLRLKFKKMKRKSRRKEKNAKKKKLFLQRIAKIFGCFTTNTDLSPKRPSRKMKNSFDSKKSIHI